jgi:hypothetical protein
VQGEIYCVGRIILCRRNYIVQGELYCAGRIILYLLANKTTGDGQNNANSRQYMNKRVCVGCTAVSIICPSFVCVQSIHTRN